VLVLKGGVSSEREVSLLSAAGVAKSLRDAGFDVREYDIQQLEITEDMRWADVVYPVLHGGFGEDGTLQKMLEDAGIRTVGSPSESMKIVMDKVASKKVMDENRSAFLISGSGSTCLAVVDVNRSEEVASRIRDGLKNSKYSWQVIPMIVDHHGAHIVPW
jgi:hypothetical protein